FLLGFYCDFIGVSIVGVFFVCISVDAYFNVSLKSFTRSMLCYFSQKRHNLTGYATKTVLF
ncbi:MAG: hypothetical protein OXU23_15050, partial [Candidatus Poribacteria bacterium]|nr:hypothetical protein [Candidatus Poribacteria bacterium]